MECGGLVYVCDDTEQIRRLIRLNLELEGYEVEEVADGQELLERLDRTEQLPGVITLDAQMMPRDGWWAIARIRADARLAHIPVVMVTASVQQQDRDQAQGSGLDAFVSKPFDPEQLIEIVRGFMADGRGHAPAP
ncbi:response regulator [Nostocoides sp. HKS02]|uniref:response regulator n=1 Tax=Nostocoides sp. HKS02 TaxID=1813880 RepID=UPI0012B4ABE5|nr:response regulator [Tetrasphaera sp. HKS02]QGN57933.1 response regulator [Tetrasphaera sp. HKS02]